MAQSESGASPAAGGASERLESWKDIANYLKRGVTTVQRWEKQEGLPVHRHLHDKLGTVYAYKPEIDAWWENGRSRLEQQEQVRASSRRPLWWAVAAAVVVVAAAGVGLWLWLGQQPALPFEERDWVLIAQFENRTGEAVFDGTLEYALERELSNSRFVNVVPRQRINDTLRLMKKPLDTPINATIGRELALRDGGIRVLLTGRVEKLDNTYLLSASLVRPADGTTVASFSEEAVGQKEVVPALRWLSSRVRVALGEELAQIQESEQKLEKVTTPSLRALQLFSQADDSIRSGSPAAAEELLRQAIVEDPEFASAYMHLAWAIRNQRRPSEEYHPYAERAVELSQKVGERERYFILGSYYSLLDEYEKALPPYEALLRLYPDHYFGNNNLVHAYARLDRQSEAIPYLVRAAELRPNDFRFNARAADGLVRYLNDFRRAKPYLERARALLTPELIRKIPFFAAWVEIFPVREHLSKGEVEQALGKLDGVAERLNLDFENEATLGSYAIPVGFCYYDLGKLAAAEQAWQKIHRSESRHSLLALASLARGDMWAMRRRMEKVVAHKNVDTLEAWLFARTGLLAAARRAIVDMEKKKQPLARILYVRAEVARAENNVEDAASLYRAAINAAQPDQIWIRALASEALAQIREEEGDLEEAVALLESVHWGRVQAFFNESGFDWMQRQLLRARLYRKVGRMQEAEEIEAELRKLLAYADADHAILRQLKRTEDVAVAQPPS